jgi:surface antigen
MTALLRILPAVILLLLAGCTSSAPRQVSSGPIVTQPLVQQPATLPPREQTQMAMAMTDVSAFLDPAAMRLIGEGARTQATAAQFNALEYGRPGAPRDWQGGDGTSSGRVTVGPDLNVNNLRCRNFTHTVTVSGKAYVRAGQACREPAAGWMVTTSRVG